MSDWPALQRRHFQAIADIIGELGDEGETFTLDAVARKFADKLRYTNPQFDRDRFLTACKVD